MKKYRLLFLILLTSIFSFAQSIKQVQWNYTAKKIADKNYEVHFSASINGGYHLYGQDASGENLAATTFTFIPNPLVILNGKVEEPGKIISKYEPALKHDVKYYEKEADFVQIIKLKANAKTHLAGKIEFTVCNEKQCLPTSVVEINVNVGGSL